MWPGGAGRVEPIRRFASLLKRPLPRCPPGIPRHCVCRRCCDGGPVAAGRSVPALACGAHAVRLMHSTFASRSRRMLQKTWLPRGWKTPMQPSRHLAGTRGRYRGGLGGCIVLMCLVSSTLTVHRAGPPSSCASACRSKAMMRPQDAAVDVSAACSVLTPHFTQCVCVFGRRTGLDRGNMMPRPHPPRTPVRATPTWGSATA